MRRAALALGIVVLGSILVARHKSAQSRAEREEVQPSPAEPEAPGRRTSRIVGTVRNERGEGVPGAGVRARDAVGSRFSAETGADGAYVLDGLTPGRYLVSPSMPGKWRLKSAQVDVPEGGEVRKDFVACCGPGIRGRIRDTRDHAVEGIELRPTYNDEQWAISDTAGAFSVSSSEPATTMARDPRGRYAPWEGEISDGVVITLEDGATIEGQVVRRETGAPVADAKLHLREEQPTYGGYVWPQGADATSGRDGTFRMVGRPKGRGVLEASAPGLSPLRIELHARAGETTHVRVEMGAGGAVEVTVLGPDGQPVAGAKVMRAEFLDGLQWSGEPNPAAATAAAGRALLERLEPGRRRIAVTSPDFLPSITVVEIPADGARVAVTMVLRQGGAIEGRTTSTVLVLSRDDAIYREASPRPDGTYRIAGLPAGAYHVGGNFSCRAVFVVEGETTRCDVDVKGAVVRGRALVGGAPTEGRLNLLARDAGLAPMLGSPIRPDAEGRFAFPSVLPGRYDLVFEGHGYRPVEVPPSAAEVTADLLLGAELIEGRVVGPDGAGIAGAFVCAVPADVRSDSHLAEIATAEGETAADGSFRLTVDATEYVLLAFSTDPPGRAFSGPVRAGKGTGIDLRIGDGGIRARVVGPDRGPALAAVVAVLDEEGRTLAEGFSDGLAVTLEGLPPGVYDVVAAIPRQGFASTRAVRVDRGAVTAISLTIGEGGSLEAHVGAAKTGGRVLVTLPDGRGVPNALNPLRFSLPPRHCLILDPVAAATDVRGVARIDGLSAGEYEGRAETSDGRSAEFAFTIRDGETTRVRVDPR